MPAIVGGIALLAVVAAIVVWRSFFAGSDPPPSEAISQPDASTDASADENNPISLVSVPSRATTPWDELDDPGGDGWQSEVFSARAGKQLKKLGALLARADEIDAVSLKPLVTVDFRCGPIFPTNLSTAFESKALRVQRATIDPAALSSRQFGPLQGADGLAAALTALGKPFHGASNVRVKFKLFRVETNARSATTRQYLSIFARTPGGMIEQNATWVARWKLGDDGAAPRLTWIGVEQFEQVSTNGSQGPFFVDCTESILAGNACYREQMLRGLNHWLGASQDRRFLFLLGNPGLAVGDVNGDGLDDLYVCQEAGLPNRLFIQNEDATARDTSEEAGVNWLENSRCALLVDLDNDGDQDLVVAIDGGVVLAANDGHGNFKLRTVLDTSDDVLSLCAADYNGDGRLDLYAGVYHRDTSRDDSPGAAIPAAGGGVVYHDANSGGANSLFRNDSDGDAWRFTDVTRQVGLDVNNRRFTLATGWEDFDNDGDQDLYVANDFGRNNLFRNDLGVDGRRHFVDVAAAANAEDSASGMSVAWGDYDRDGWMDLYVSNMFSAAGNRITFQEQFKAGASAKVKSRLQRFARGNTLLHNQSGKAFDDRSTAAGVAVGRWAWGSSFVDLNNDGWDDLIVANGYITTAEDGDL
ncbi:MAG: VCBS repeat-containing protein [Planctomycetes bacterium]|nr:VCBS repeat-containing protein [Planctomycetota bacterium]